MDILTLPAICLLAYKRFGPFSAAQYLSSNVPVILYMYIWKTKAHTHRPILRQNNPSIAIYHPALVLPQSLRPPQKFGKPEILFIRVDAKTTQITKKADVACPKSCSLVTHYNKPDTTTINDARRKLPGFGASFAVCPALPGSAQTRFFGWAGKQFNGRI